MSRDENIHAKDGIIFEGDVVGHSDEKKRIRKRDGIIFKGEEVGYIDKDQQIREKDGIIFKGDVVGKVKERTAFDKDGIIFKGQEFGYVDKDGNIRIRDGIIFKGRIIGKVKGHNIEEALGFYVLKFKQIEERYEKLKQDVEHNEDKAKYLGKIRSMLEYVPKADALGDFDSLISRLRQLENIVIKYLETNLAKKAQLCAEAEALSTSTDWKNTGKRLDQLQDEWKKIGAVPKEKADQVWERFARAKQKFYDNRKRHYEQLEQERKKNLALKQNLCQQAESFSHSTDWKVTSEKFKQLQAEWKKIGQVPREEADRLWKRFNDARQRFYDNRTRFHEQKDQERKRNLSQKERLCHEAESLSYSTDWKSTGERFKRLQEEWKQIGQVPKEEADRLWKRFNEARQRFYDNRTRHFEQVQREREQKQAAWRENMQNVLRQKEQTLQRLEESIRYDETKVYELQSKIYNIRPGRRADEIRDSLESKIRSIENKITSKRDKVSQIHDSIRDIEAKLYRT